MSGDLRYPASFGPYELLGRLGQGASGSAHLARPGIETVGVPTPVVIKRLHGTIEQRPEFVRRFRHEAEIAVLVDSPHVARVFDVGTASGRLYIAIEYVPGWTLGKLLGVLNQRNRPPPLEVAAEVARQFLRGLVHLHAAKDRSGRLLEVVHRDISPKNLMVGDDGRVRVIDLGLGKSRAQDWKTQAGRVMGSPGYMPPEQIAGAAVDQRADVYAAAVVCHELFTAERYIALAEPVTMLREALQKPYRAVRELRPDAPRALDEVLSAAVRPDPERRTPDAGLLLEEIEQVFGPSPARPNAVAEWVRETLPGEQSARRAEVRRLLASPRLSPETGPDVQDTEVWVTRAGVTHGGTRILRIEPATTSPVAPDPGGVAPTRVAPGPATPRVGLAVRPAHGWSALSSAERIRLGVALGVGAVLGSAGTGLIGGLAGAPDPATPSVVASPSRSAGEQGAAGPSVSADRARPAAAPGPRLEAGAVRAFSPVGMAASPAASSRREGKDAPPLRGPEERPADPSAQPVPSGVGAAEGAVMKAPSRSEGPRAGAEASFTRAPSRAGERRPDRKGDPSRLEAKARVLARRLEERANALRKSGGEEAARAAARLMGRVQLAERVPDPARRLAQLEALAVELKALERR